MPSQYHLLRRYSSDAWTSVPKIFYRLAAHCGAKGSDVLAAADLLGRLIFLADRNKHLEENDFWFRCPVGELIEKYYGISDYVQARLMGFLEQADLIESDTREVPATKWVRINIERIDQLVEQLEQEPVPETSGKLGPETSGKLGPETSGKLLLDKGTKIKSPYWDKSKPACGFGRPEGRMGKSPKKKTHLSKPRPSSNGHLPRPKKGLIQELTPPQDPKTTPFDRYCARMLREAINTKTRLVARWQVKIQAREFAKLRRQVAQDTERIEAVLEWYCEHLHQSKELRLPKSLTSPAQFVKCFDWIEERYHQYQEDHPPEVPVSEGAQRIAERLARLRWPKGSKEQLPQLVQRGLDVYGAFVRRVYRLEQRLEQEYKALTPSQIQQDGRWVERKPQNPNWRKLQPKVHRRYVEVKLFRERLPSATHFLETWYEDVHQQVANWDRWSGNFRSLAFSLEHPKFEKQAREWSESWDRIRSLLEKEEP